MQGGDIQTMNIRNLYARIKIPSFIATLGTMNLWQSMAWVVSCGAPVQVVAKYWPRSPSRRRTSGFSKYPNSVA
jgi:ribose/xylose/arabinose/galactoside ABC-type transport system permease subunit